jgi:iron complex outermembrane receptor protein
MYWRRACCSTPSGSNTYKFASGEVSLRHEFGRDVSAYIGYANAQTGRAYDLEDQVSASLPAATVTSM